MDGDTKRMITQRLTQSQRRQRLRCHQPEQADAVQRFLVCHPALLLLLIVLHANVHGSHNQCVVAFGFIVIPSSSSLTSLTPRGRGATRFSTSFALSSSSTSAPSSRVMEDAESSSSLRQQQQRYSPRSKKGRSRRRTEPNPSLSSSISQSQRKQNDVYETLPPSSISSSSFPEMNNESMGTIENQSIPWNADYATSIQTQNRIQQAAVQAEANIWNNSHNDDSGGGSGIVHGSNSISRSNNAAVQKAIGTILQTLHDTPPELCNAANIVCALTLSSKLLERSKMNRRKLNTSSSSSSSNNINNYNSNANHLETNEHYVTLLTQTLTTLSSLVAIPNQLSPRQLCNAAWALAKFVVHDDATFTNVGRGYSSVITKTTTATPTTTWNLRQENDEKVDPTMSDGTTTVAPAVTTSGAISTSSRKMDVLIDKVFNLIALRVIEHLEQIQNQWSEINASGDEEKAVVSTKHHTAPAPAPAPGQKQQHAATNIIIRPGELSMLLWAYAIVGPRDRPPGWESPRRLDRLSSSSSDDDFVGGDGKINNGNSIGVDAGQKLTNNADLVTFVELDSFSTSDHKSNNKNSDDEALGSSPDGRSNTVDRLFDAAAIAFCHGKSSRIVVAEEEEHDPTTLLSNCTWRELSNIAWSYATRGAYISKESERMMSFIAKQATSRIRSCINGRSARNIGGAAATTASRENNISNFLPRDAIQIAWALGTMESDNVNSGDFLVYLVDAIHDYWIGNGDESDTAESSNRRSRPLAQWTCADLVQMATAMAHGRLDNQSVLDAIYRESLGRIRGDNGAGRGGSQHQGHNKGFSTSEISILMWVQARLHLTPKFGNVYAAFPGTASRELLRRMGSNNEQLPKRMRQIGLGPQEQANLAWSLTVLEDYNDSVVSLLQNIFHAASSSMLPSSSSEYDERIIQLEHAHQLWQSYFLLNKDCPDATKSVPLEFRNYLEEKWKLEKSRSKQSSSRHRAISQTLNLMKVAHRNEYDEDVDVAIVLEDNSVWTHTAQSNFEGLTEEGHRKVAVEFDGPHHFTRTASTEEALSLMKSGAKFTPRVLGHTVLKYRLLKRKGWTVIRIPYYEFDKIPFWASMVSTITILSFDTVNSRHIHITIES